jgi:hypothetical protein
MGAFVIELLHERVGDTGRSNATKIIPRPFVLRYGSTWEIVKVNSEAAATAQQIQRELDLLKRWRPTARPRTESASKLKTLDAAMDE